MGESLEYSVPATANLPTQPFLDGDGYEQCEA